MKIKAVILAACMGSALVAGSAFAEPGKGQRHAPDPAARAAHMQKTLQLNDTQRQQVQKILEETKTQREALANKYKIAEREAFMKDAKALHEKSRGQIDALLTPAQREALETMKTRHGKHGKHHRGHGKQHHGKEAKPAS
jgi:Spy/CpxP family protein refolding chaperone